MAAFRSLGFSTRIPLIPIACGHRAKFGFLRSQPASRKPPAFISISTKPSVPLLKTMIFTGSSCCRERDKVAHHHGEAAVARHRDHLTLGKGGLRADGVQHGVRHGSMMNDPMIRRFPFTFR